ncbi:hypothetical protein GMRT_13565 [Giardia muris]|uniref:Uncharacterized protein n=1 Tax=Giardia muris TaxID=5742 RepID=A0A4Z1SYZ9_GIAMU|nr:hypothetical protein GMRT_13565 [Giardia muris]|eukprot:TNJ29985.1 hypothetical protein GMRT_13565 [Giardia muris]
MEPDPQDIFVPHELLEGFTVAKRSIDEEKKTTTSQTSVPIVLCDKPEDSLIPLDTHELESLINVPINRLNAYTSTRIDDSLCPFQAYMDSCLMNHQGTNDPDGHSHPQLPTLAEDPREMMLFFINQLRNGVSTYSIQRWLETGYISRAALSDMLVTYDALLQPLPEHERLILRFCHEYVKTGNIRPELFEQARRAYMDSQHADKMARLRQNLGNKDCIDEYWTSDSNKDSFYRTEAMYNKFVAQKLIDYAFGGWSNAFLGGLTLSSIGGSMYTYHKPFFNNSLAIFNVTRGEKNHILRQPPTGDVIFSYDSGANPQASEASPTLTDDHLYTYTGRFFVAEHVEPFSLAASLPGMAYRLALYHKNELSPSEAQEIIRKKFYFSAPFYGRMVAAQEDVSANEPSSTDPEPVFSEATMTRSSVQRTQQMDASVRHNTISEEERYSYLFPPIVRKQVKQIRQVPDLHIATEMLFSSTDPVIDVAPHIEGQQGTAICCFYGQRNRFLLVKDRRHLVTQDLNPRLRMKTSTGDAKTTSSIELIRSNWVFRELPTVALFGQMIPSPAFQMDTENIEGRSQTKQVKTEEQAEPPIKVDELSTEQSTGNKRAGRRKPDSRNPNDNIRPILGPPALRGYAKRRIDHFLFQIFMNPEVAEYACRRENIDRRYSDINNGLAKATLFRETISARMNGQGGRNQALGRRGGVMTERTVCGSDILQIVAFENFLATGAFVNHFFDVCRADYYMAKLALTDEKAAMFLVDRFLGWSYLSTCYLTNTKLAQLHAMRERADYKSFTFIDQNAQKSFGAQDLVFGCFEKRLSNLASDRVDEPILTNLLKGSQMHLFPFALDQLEGRIDLLNGIYSVMTDPGAKSYVMYPHERLRLSNESYLGLFTRMFENHSTQANSLRGEGAQTSKREADTKRSEELNAALESLKSLEKATEVVNIEGHNCNCTFVPKNHDKRNGACDNMYTDLENFGLCSKEIHLYLEMLSDPRSAEISEKDFIVVYQNRESPFLRNQEQSAIVQKEPLPTILRNLFITHLNPKKVVSRLRKEKSDRGTINVREYFDTVGAIVREENFRRLLSADQRRILRNNVQGIMEDKRDERDASLIDKAMNAFVFITGETTRRVNESEHTAMLYRQCPFLTKKALQRGGRQAENVIERYTQGIRESETVKNAMAGAFHNPCTERFACFGSLYFDLSLIHQYASGQEREGHLSNEKAEISDIFPYTIIGETGLPMENSPMDADIKASATRDYWSADEVKNFVKVAKLIHPLSDQCRSSAIRVFTMSSLPALQQNCMVLDTGGLNTIFRNLDKRDTPVTQTRRSQVNQSKGATDQHGLVQLERIHIKNRTIKDQLDNYWRSRKRIIGITYLFNKLGIPVGSLHWPSHEGLPFNAVQYDTQYYTTIPEAKIVYCPSIIPDMSIISDYTCGNMNLHLAREIHKHHQRGRLLFTAKAGQEMFAERYASTMGPFNALPEPSLYPRDTKTITGRVYNVLRAYPGWTLDRLGYGVREPWIITIPRDAVGTTTRGHFIKLLQCTVPAADVAQNFFSPTESSMRFTELVDEIHNRLRDFRAEVPEDPRRRILQDPIGEIGWRPHQDASYLDVIFETREQLLNPGPWCLQTFPSTSILLSDDALEVIKQVRESRSSAQELLRDFVGSFFSRSNGSGSHSEVNDWITKYFGPTYMKDPKFIDGYKRCIAKPVFLESVLEQINRRRVKSLLSLFLYVVESIYQLVCNTVQYNVPEDKIPPNNASEETLQSQLRSSMEGQPFYEIGRCIIHLITSLRKFFDRWASHYAVLHAAEIQKQVASLQGVPRLTDRQLRALFLEVYTQIEERYLRNYKRRIMDDVVAMGYRQRNKLL